MKIDPRIFIHPPYIICPHCGQEKFGITIINGYHYERRCGVCLFPGKNDRRAIFSLPEIRKKIIYLDQFAISNMMKLLSPRTSTARKQRIDKFWCDLFERLDILVKAQLIVCPYSESHQQESLLLPQHFYEIRRMYEYLSNNESFQDFDRIRQKQLYDHCRAWIRKESLENIEYNPDDIAIRGFHYWTDVIAISINTRYSQATIDAIQSGRLKVSVGLGQIFKRWQGEKGKKLEDWFTEEYKSYSINGIPQEWLIRENLRSALEQEGVLEDKITIKCNEFLESESRSNVPFIRISCAMYAALAQSASEGRRKLPNVGMQNDINFISILLPYCDAMLVDNECYELLNKSKGYISNYGTKIYCKNNSKHFMDYLDNILISASEEHMKHVNEVYGEMWKKPYLALYGD